VIPFLQQHKKPRGSCPAMAAGVSDTLCSVAELTEMPNAT
jgi:hypothetical protein